MLNIISLIIGVLAALFALLGLIPLLGWINWFMLPFAFVGLILGVLSSSNAGRNLNLIVLLVGMLRLFIGGGIL